MRKAFKMKYKSIFQHFSFQRVFIKADKNNFLKCEMTILTNTNESNLALNDDSLIKLLLSGNDLNYDNRNQSILVCIRTFINN